MFGDSRFDHCGKSYDGSPLLTRSASGAEAGENSYRGRIWLISSFGSCDHPAAAMRSETIPNEAPHRIRYGAEELQRHLGGG